MGGIKNTIEPGDVEWIYKDKTDAAEVVFEPEMALAHLLINEVVFLNDHWWEKSLPKHIQDAPSVNVLCNDVFAWGTGDSEALPYKEIETVYQMWKQDPSNGPAKWCALRRNEKPQAPVVKDMKRAGVWDDAMEALRPNRYDAAMHRAFAKTGNGDGQS